MKKYILSFILGAIIFGSVGVLASQIFARDVSYGNTNVESALNDLYSKANNVNNLCLLVDGTSKNVSAKYVCNLGDNVSRYFYVLKVNTNDVKLIMERNITDIVGSNKTMTWNDALNFFDENHEGYNTKQTWLAKVIDVDLPSAQDIADAGGILNWNVNQSTLGDYYFGGSTSTRENYSWLFNYTNGCESGGCSNNSNFSYGYWTNDLVFNNDSNAWPIGSHGGLGVGSIFNNTHFGVRPVITVLKSQLN